MKRYSFFILFFLGFIVQVLAADPVIDSLKTELQNAKSDSLKAEILITLSKTIMVNSPESAMNYAKDAKASAEKAGYKKGIGTGLKWIGISFFNEGKYVEALQNYQQAKAIFEDIGFKAGVANMVTNMGNVYYNQGDDQKALELYLQSLKISEELKDTLRITTALVNIGAVYANKPATYGQAVQYLLRALPLGEAIDDQELVGGVDVNIGEIYLTGGKIDSALYYFQKSLIAYTGTENVPYVLNNIGKVYMKQKEYDKAIDIQFLAYEKAKSMDGQNDMAISLQGLASTFEAKGDNANALKYYLQAEEIAKQTRANYYLKDIYKGLSDVYANLGDFGKAFKYQNQLLAIKDTIYNIEADKKLTGLLFNYEIDKKQGQIDLMSKDQLIQEQEIRRQRLVKNGFIGGFAVVLLFAGVFFSQRNKISREKKRSDELLLNILPEETAEELKATGSAKAKSFDQVSVMFTDFKNFTQASELLTAEELVQEINYCYSEFDKIISKYNIEKIKTIGDSYMCAGGLPVSNTTHPVDVIKAGLEMQEFIVRHKEDRIARGQPYFDLRLGIHTGPVVAGIVGIKKFAYDIWGDTVNTASRMESSGQIGKVNISGTTYELVKDRFVFTPRGKVEAKNKGQIDMYFVERAL